VGAQGSFLVARVIVGFAATAATLFVYGVLFPVAVMALALYAVKLLPLSGRKKRRPRA
jgi:hypothetical protein